MFSVSKKSLRILDFDTECRPMHYSEWRPESMITAIAWSWVEDDFVDDRMLKRGLKNEISMLLSFLAAYESADIVTGHYIRKHDLPLLNDHSLRLLGKPIAAKMTQDTMSDLTSVKSLGKSQDNLAVTLGLDEQKHHMTGADWRFANSLDPRGVDLARTRVVNDVKQHKAIRRALLDRHALGQPRLWYP